MLLSKKKLKSLWNYPNDRHHIIEKTAEAAPSKPSTMYGISIGVPRRPPIVIINQTSIIKWSIHVNYSGFVPFINNTPRSALSAHLCVF